VTQLKVIDDNESHEKPPPDALLDDVVGPVEVAVLSILLGNKGEDDELT
jgi:hypothetical protein